MKFDTKDHNLKVRCIAYYLPQYHPIPENDAWWGKGFTEWTNVTKAVPLYKGHYQPRFPSDLGYYDLRVKEVRAQQADMARSYGIDGFIYYHYWFGNRKQLLERPFNEVLESGEPDFPFALCWANETWRTIWFGARNETLVTQTYPGLQDYEDHFQYLLKAFRDKRYITVEGKPFFQVYKPFEIPDLPFFVRTFRRLAEESGLPGIFLVAGRAPAEWNPTEHGFDAVTGSEFSTLRYVTAKDVEEKSFLERAIRKMKRSLNGKIELDLEKRNTPIIVDYRKAIRYLLPDEVFPFDYYPCVIPDWDNSARAGNSSLIFQGSTPELWKEHLRRALELIRHLPDERRFLVIKSWNEWAEGNYLEPDRKWGHAYLQALKDALAE